MTLSVQTLHAASATFEAARHLDLLPSGHRARRLHGHGFRVDLRCALPPGWARFAGGEVDRLRSELAAGVGKLDHRLLNEEVDSPTNQRLARWLLDRLDVPGVARIGIQSTAHEGVDLDREGRAQAWRRYGFESAHRLPNVPPGHKCGRMHGHGFEVVVHARLAEGADDDGLDNERLDSVWAPHRQQLAHACLNDLPGLPNPTSELLSSWLWERIRPGLPGLAAITVYETASCGAQFDGFCHRIWKDFTLDSALQLRQAPDGSPLRRLHGHTYTLRLGLSASLDQVMGWTIDFGDVKQLFDPIFRALDHQPLHEIAGLADCDAASIAGWVFRQAQSRLPQLDRVELYETRGCGAIVDTAPTAWPLLR